ncbi:MAG TPA: flippase [Candidatus Acidoferrum sp.]|nr:flippase [Candidatus Acidoferrum sp.]
MSMLGSTRLAASAKPIATRVVQNTAVLLTGRILSVLLGGVGSVLIVRSLGIEQLGEFSSVYAYVSMFAWLATLGIESVLTRESARRRERSGSIIATGGALCGVFAIAAAVFVILLAPHAGYRGKTQVLVVFATIELLVLAPLRLAGVIFQVDLRQWYGTVITLARQILWLLIIILLARAKGSLTAFVLGRLSAAVVETILIIVMSVGFLIPPRRIIVQDFKVYLRACIPLALTMLLASIYLRIDQVMLHRLASDKILGSYAAAVKVSELLEMFPAALLASVFPVLAIAANDKQRMAVYVDRIFRYLMAAAGLLCTLICVGSGLIVHTLYGPQFEPSAHLLNILIWSEFAVFFGSAVGNILLARNLQNYFIYPTIAGAIVNVLLNLIWIPRYAAMGSAWATLVSYTFAWAVVLLGFSETRGIVWEGLRKGFPVALLSAAVAVIVSSLPLPSVVRLATAFGLYGVGIGALRTIRAGDIQYLRSAFSQTLGRSD